MIQKRKENKNRFELTNPIFKAKKGFYDDIMKVDFGGRAPERTDTERSAEESDRVPL